MSNAVIPFDPRKLAQSLKQVTREVAPAGQFLKMDKTGDWVYGIEQESMPEGVELMVNPGGFSHGYVAWGEGEKLGEIIAPVTEALPETGPVPGGARGWEFQLGVHLKGITGKIKDVEFIYRVSSVGGKRAVAGLADLVSEKLNADDSKIVPVITLDSDSYKHKEYGKIFVPVFNIVRWVDMPKAAKAETKAPAKKR